MQKSQEYELEPGRREAKPRFCVFCEQKVDRLTSLDLCRSCSRELGRKGRREMVKAFYQ